MWKHSQLHNNFRKIATTTEYPEVGRIWESTDVGG